MINLERMRYVMNQTIYYTAQDLQEMLNISRAKAYRIIQDLNKQLDDMGYIVIAGKVPKKFLAEKLYGMS